MNRPLHPGLATRDVSPLARSESAQIVRTERRPQRSRPLMRKYEVAYLAPNGDGHTAARLAPASAYFEAPFMGFARGTLIATPMGPVAIEDILPGDLVATEDRGPLPVRWKGATTIVPGAPGQSDEAARLTRVPCDALGMHRPSHDLLLGFGARVLRANRGHVVPASALVDDETAFTVTPPSPVRVFHLALEEHALISANGIAAESFHPGPADRIPLRPEIKALYLSLFPHLHALEEFGPQNIQRAAEEELLQTG